MVDERSDPELVAASLDDPDCFAEVFRRHGSAVFKFLTHRVGVGLAADFTGEVFARAFHLRARFDLSRESARPWLYGIAANVVGDHLRRQDVRRRRGLSIQVGMLDRPADPYSQVEADVDAQRLRAQVTEALQGLRRGDREVLLLHALEGLTYSEVAEALGLPIGTVRSRLWRARRRMRELLPDDIQRIFLTDDGGIV